MSDCCNQSDCVQTHPNKYRCPVSGNESSEVEVITIVHHVREPWLWTCSGKRYFFCDDPDCDVVYFDEDGATITRSQIRSVVGIKEESNDAPLCYCYGISRADAMKSPDIKAYVISQTKQGQCKCTVFNPSGRCCLKDFP